MANEQDQITEEVGCSGDPIEEGFLIRSDRVLTDIRSRKFFNGYFNYIPAKFGGIPYIEIILSVCLPVFLCNHVRSIYFI